MVDDVDGGVVVVVVVVVDDVGGGGGGTVVVVVVVDEPVVGGSVVVVVDEPAVGGLVVVVVVDDVVLDVVLDVVVDAVVDVDDVRQRVERRHTEPVHEVEEEATAAGSTAAGREAQPDRSTGEVLRGPVGGAETAGSSTRTEHVVADGHRERRCEPR